jgi:hypothetical protein
MYHADNPNKVKAIIFSTDKPFCTKASDNSRDPEVTAGKAPSIEVLGLGRLAVVPPSIHKDEDTGVECPYETALEQHIDNICRKYGIKYLEGAQAQTTTITSPDGTITTTTTTLHTRSQTPIQELLKPDYRVVKGNNRHGALLRIMDHLLIKYGTWDLEFVKSLALEWNEQHCISAEDGKSPAPVDSKDFEDLFKQSQQWVAKKAGEQKSKIQVSKNDKQNKKKQYSVDEANEEAAGEGEDEDNGDRRRHLREKTDLAFAKAKKIFSPLFKDQFGTCYTWTKIPGKEHREIVKIGKGKFKKLLLKLFHDTVGEVPRPNVIDTWVDTFHALAEFDGPTVHSFLIETMNQTYSISSSN